MLGEVVNFHSSQKDVHDLLVLLNLDNLYDEFDEEIYTSIYKVSKAALGTARVKLKQCPKTSKTLDRALCLENLT